jgi:hypothetical protein
MKEIQWRVKPEHCDPSTMASDKDWTWYESATEKDAESRAAHLNDVEKHTDNRFEFRVEPV